MSFETQGRLHKKFDTAQVSASFQKREFVIEIEDGAYSQLIKFQVTQDKCSLLDDFNEGDTISVTFNLRGREWTNRNGEIVYFTNLQAWKIEKPSSAASSSQPVNTGGSNIGSFPSLSDAPPQISTTDNDDLPF